MNRTDSVVRWKAVALWASLVIVCMPCHARDSSNLAEAIQLFVDRREIAGAVMLVATKDRLVTLEAVGDADLAGKKPMAPDTLFWIASMTKAVTGTALMMLVDEGKIALDDPVQKYLPEFKPRIMRGQPGEARVTLQAPRHPITVRQLLSHRSGLPMTSSLEGPVEISPGDGLPLAQRVRSYTLQPLLFEPGTHAIYSNAGINTAGRIIEVVSGQAIEAFLQQRLFDPLGMNDTTFWPTPAQVARLAKSYRPNAATASAELEETPIFFLRYPLSDRAHRHAAPGGGLFSTAGDLARFCQMLLNEGTAGGKRFLSAAAIQEMSRNQGGPGQPGYEGWGLGWQVRNADTYGHSGAYNTRMLIDRAHGLITILLVQQAVFAGDPREPLRLVFDQAVTAHYYPRASE